MTENGKATSTADAVGTQALEGGAAWLAQLGRFRYQFLGAIVFAVLMPVYLRWGDDAGGWLQPVQINTIMASSLAILIGLVALRQLAVFPGVRESYYLVPVLLVSFLVVFAVMFFGRIEYNRYLFPTSYVLTVLWVFFAQSIARQYGPLKFAIVPGGEVGSLNRFSGVHWLLLDKPELPKRLSGIVADLRQDMSPAWERFIADCAISGVRVFHVKQIQESMSGKVEIEHLSENTLGSLNPDALYLKLKQAADWALAGIIVFLASPLLVAVAIAIRLETPGPALFRQERVGFRGKLFRVFKFRTMALEQGTDAKDPRELAITLADDQRITRIGRLLRRFRFDELPQVLNILNGEMSWIGPRPEAVALSEWYEKELPFYRYRHIVRPGISGWAQVNQGHVTQTDQVLEKLHYDFYYIKNFSPWLDALILLRTIRTVLTGYGAR